MPNHVSNSLTVTGPGAEDFMARVAQTIEAEPNFIQTFAPMPEALSSIHTGGNSIDGEYVKAWRHIDGKDVAVSPEEIARLRTEHGAKDWYEWAINNWGTKWGAYAVKVTDGRITFDSAWSPPLPALESISMQYPEATFTLAFAEGGMDYYGTATAREGEVLVDERGGCTDPDADWDSPEAEENPDYGFTPAFAAHLAEHGLHSGG